MDRGVSKPKDETRNGGHERNNTTDDGGGCNGEYNNNGMCDVTDTAKRKTGSRDKPFRRSKSLYQPRDDVIVDVIDSSSSSGRRLKLSRSLSLDKVTSSSDNPPVAPGDTLEAILGTGITLGRRLRRYQVDDVIHRVDDKLPAAPSDIDAASDVIRRRSVVSSQTPLEVKGSEVRQRTAERIFIKEQQTQLLSTPAHRLTGFAKWKYYRAREWKRTKRNIANFFSNFKVWKDSFKTVEGTFGSSVVSYFEFLKWLFFLNIFTTLVLLSVIVLPQAFMAPGAFNDTLAGPVSESLSGYALSAAECSANYSSRVAATVEENSANVSALIVDFFQGTGFMENTYLFMGYYFNKTWLLQDDRPHYNMPLAYILAHLGYLIVTLIIMVAYTASGVRESIVTKGEKFYQNSFKVFCGWDYSLVDQKAAIFKHKHLHQSYVKRIEEQERERRRREMKAGAKCRLLLVRLLVNLLSLAILVGSAALIYFVVVEWVPLLKLKDTVQESSVLLLIVEYLPSLTITALNLIVPLVFEKIVLVEDFSPSTEIKVTIGWSVILRLASLVVLAITLASQVTCPSPERRCGNCGDIGCWETFVGQEIYKLVITDLLVVAAIVLLMDFPRRALAKALPQFPILQQEFNIAKSVLDVIYTQSLCWWGSFFSPLIAAITVVKLFIFFYCKKGTLLINCVPSSRPYRASRTNHFFMMSLMVAFALSVSAFAFTIGRIPPSQSCSPFRIYSQQEYNMFNALTDALDLLPAVVQDIIDFINSWIFYTVLIGLLILVIYYHTSVSAGNKKMAAILTEQLQLAEKDKQFLLDRVNEALQKGAFTG